MSYTPYEIESVDIVSLTCQKDATRCHKPFHVSIQNIAKPGFVKPDWRSSSNLTDSSFSYSTVTDTSKGSLFLKDKHCNCCSLLHPVRTEFQLQQGASILINSGPATLHSRFALSKQTIQVYIIYIYCEVDILCIELLKLIGKD